MLIIQEEMQLTIQTSVKYLNFIMKNIFVLILIYHVFIY